MSDLRLFVEELVAWRTGSPTGEVEVAGAPAGPAGVVAIEIAGGAVEVSVDAASPGWVTGVRVPAGPAAPASARTALDRVVGAGASALLDEAADEPATGWVAGDLDRHRWPGDPRHLPVLPAVVPAPLVGRAASLRAEVTDAMLDDAALVLALLELGALHDELAALDVRPGPGPAWRRAATLLEDLDRSVDDLVDDLPPDGRRRLAGYAARAVQHLGPGDGDLRARLDLDPALGTLAGARLVESRVVTDAMVVDLAPMASPLAAPPPAGAAAAGPPPPAPRPVAVSPALGASVVSCGRDGSHVDAVVRFDHPPPSGVDGPWLRAFDDRDRRHPVLVAAAPFVGSPFGAHRASALVPPGVDDRTLLLDVVPSVAGPPVRTAPSVRAAVAAGRRAVRADRAGRGPAHGRGAEAWRDCADRWAALDDATRSKAANAYATVPVGAEPFLHELHFS